MQCLALRSEVSTIRNNLVIYIELLESKENLRKCTLRCEYRKGSFLHSPCLRRSVCLILEHRLLEMAKEKLAEIDAFLLQIDTLKKNHDEEIVKKHS